MDRYTFMSDGYPAVKENVCYMDQNEDYCGDAIDRLAAYEDTGLEPDRVRRLELALLSMVYQYCKEEDGDWDYMHHHWMEAGEEAFELLGIKNFSRAEDVWKRIEEAEAALGGDEHR